MSESMVERSIEKEVGKIRKLAIDNTELFLGIGGWIAPVGTVVAAVIMYCVNWAVYCYEIGYYHIGFNVPVSLIEEPKITNLSTSVVGCFLLVVALLIAALVGQWAYRKCKYILLVFGELLVISAAILCPIFSSFANMNVVEVITSVVIFLFLAMFITVLLNVFSISSLIFPSKEDKLARDKVKLKKLEKKVNDTACNKKKQAKYKNKRKTVKERIDELETQTESKKKVIPKEIIKEALLMVVITIFAFLIAGVPACFSMGINEVTQKEELTLVMNAKEIDDQFREILPSDCKISGMAIIYENNDGLLVSPCYISSGEVAIYTNLQQFIKTEGLIVYTNTYEDITPKTVALSFDNATKNNVDRGNSNEG